MKNKILFCILVSTIINFRETADAQECFREFDGMPGKCRTSAKCPRVAEEYQLSGIEPQLCQSNENHEPLVCCPNIYSPESDSTSKRISFKKCVEYDKLAYKKVIISSGLRSNNVESVSDCDFTTPLILGGEEAKYGEFPHMAVIGWTQSNGTVDFNCGGTIISEQFILTAAHCTKLNGIPPDTVRVGDHDLLSENEPSDPQNFKITDILKPIQYNKPVRYYDIAVLKVSQTIQFNRYARPACLWQSDNINVTRVVATGWGHTKYGGESSKKLLKVGLDVISNKRCEQYFQEESRLPRGIIETQMCAGVLTGGKDTCQGDSGGPLQVTTSINSCTFHVVGITSFGKFCGFAQQPAVYTRVSSHIDWIESVVWGES